MRLVPLFAGALLAALAGSASAESITIATVNNGDMIRMQKLTDDFTAKNPDIQLQWVTLEENALRQKVTTDIATKGGQYDVVTIGTYEVPIWAKQGWLLPLDNLGADYDVDDLLPAIRDGLSVDGKLYAAPFYGESSMVMYRKDLMEKAGLTMPDAPTWDFIGEAADKMTDRANGINGICLRGKAGWGENMAFLTAMSNSFGARWFDENWKPQFDQPEWKNTLQFYVDLMKDARPAGRLVQRLQREPGAVPAGQVRHVDRRHGRRAPSSPARTRRSPTRSASPSHPTTASASAATGSGPGPRHPGRARRRPRPPRSSSPGRPARTILDLVARKEGWANVPPGTRTSLYDNPEYQAAAPFAEDDARLHQRGRPDQADASSRCPMSACSSSPFPSSRAIGTTVGQLFSAALAGQMSVDDALKQAQDATTREMTKGGYLK